MNGIENGTILHPHLLPPKLRERILDKAFKQDLTDHPNVLDILTSVEFLNKLTSISANACDDYDLEFVEHLTESLATKLPSGETIGSAITKLNLKSYERVPFARFQNSYFAAVYGLMAQCPNTDSLDLRVTSPSNEPGNWPLNENGAWIHVMENLVELSLRDWTQFGNMRPIITFDRLTTLTLDYCSLTSDQWFEILENMPILENLHLFNFSCIGQRQQRGLDWILPFSLPHLKWLEIIGFGQIFECNNKFVDNLMGCPKLRQVHLLLDEKSTDEKSLIRLANMEIDLKMKIELIIRGDAAENATIFDTSSRFKLVRIFNESIDYLEMHIFEWDPQILTAFKDVLDTCSALTTFGIALPEIGSNPIRSNILSEEEMKRINAALAQFFGTWERALKLKDLRLFDIFDEAVMSAVFENCLNLDRLGIYECLALRDQHLINWVARGGGNLTHLVVRGCNVTSEGIIPILAQSAERLLSYDCSDLGQDNGGRNWETELSIHCPNARSGNHLA